jgi:hypothetical protein
MHEVSVVDRKARIQKEIDRKKKELAELEAQENFFKMLESHNHIEFLHEVREAVDPEGRITKPAHYAWTLDEAKKVLKDIWGSHVHPEKVPCLIFGGYAFPLKGVQGFEIEPKDGVDPF